MDVIADSVLVVRAGIEVLSWAVFDEHPVDVVVTTRHGGVSEGPYATLNLGFHVGDDPAAVVENRQRAAAAVGAELDELVFCRQSHGRRVVTVTAVDRGRGARAAEGAIESADALVTATPGVGLVMMGADCTPIVLYDPCAGVVGCVHSGWRGTTGRVLDATLAAMAALGARPGRTIAAVGPAIAADRYQVGPDVTEAATSAFGDVEGIVAPDGTGRWTFDLWAANSRILAEAGVPSTQMHRSALPTGTPEFFSDRAVRPCGRQGVVARLRPAGRAALDHQPTVSISTSTSKARYTASARRSRVTRGSPLATAVAPTSAS